MSDVQSVGLSSGFREVIRRCEDEVSSAIKAKVTRSRLITRDNSGDCQRGTREGPHVRATAATSHRDSTGEGVVARE